jgi:hypothetical protein
MLEMVKAAVPLLVNVALRGALGVFTGTLPKVTVVELTWKPAVETGTAAVLPPPPQEVDKKTSAMQAVAKIAAFARRR